MATLLDPNDIRALGVETDLEDDALQTVIDGADADIIRIAGDLDEESGVTEAELAREQARRKLVLLALVKLDLQYDATSSISTGDFNQSQLVYTDERARLLRTLVDGLFV